LGYEPSRWHVALVARGDGVESLIDGVMQRYEASALAVAAEASAAWLWVGMGIAPTEMQSWLSALDPPAGAMLAVGDPAHGRQGFRLTHAQAQIAAGIGQRLGQATTLYQDVALEDLAGYHPERVEQFIARELGTLTADTRKARILRETLSAYFACAQRASSAAVQLQVHERTVGIRLRRAERLLGGSVNRRRTELEVALRLHALKTPQ
jgi:sugar diacid utilization regulator